MKKINIFILAALAAALLPVSCQMEEPAEELTYTVNVPLVFGDNPTAEDIEADDEVKADVDGTTGVTTWTTGDQIAYYVSGAGANKYQVKTINGNVVPVSLTSSQSRVDFAIYPASSKVESYHTDANLRVNYPTTYNFSGMTALQMATFSPLPMVGDNNTSNIVFYNVGGLLRLTVNNVPAAAKYIKVTVPGMNITGDYTVSTPASTTPSVTATTGSNDNVTFQIAETTIGTQGNYTVNLPLPAGNYSGVTGKTITVEALNGSSSSIAAAGGAITHWTTLGRRKGKKLTVDFAPASFAINEGEATIWKSQTANFTTNATAGTVTWESETPGVATFDDPTVGEVRGVTAGTTQIRAKLNGMVYSDWVTVNVNAVTGVTLDTEDSKYKVGPGSTKTLIATLSHTSNGAITTYPTVTWKSATTDYITVSPASSTAVYATDGTATATTTATGGTAGDSSECSVTVSGSFTGTGSDLTAKMTLTCDFVTSITGSLGTFRGIIMAPGYLQYDGEAYSLTGELEGLASIMDAYGTAVGCSKHFFRWDLLSTAFPTSSDGIITGAIVGGEWRIPRKDEWYTIIHGTSFPTIEVNSVPISKGFAQVVVDLTGSPLNNKGLMTSTLSSIGDNAYDGSSVNTGKYISGVLLFPDGSTVTCSRLNGAVGDVEYWSTSTNCITYSDLKTLVEGGCVFLASTGYRQNSNWRDSGIFGRFWTANIKGGDAWVFRFGSHFVSEVDGDTNQQFYIPVRLIHN